MRHATTLRCLILLLSLCRCPALISQEQANVPCFKFEAFSLPCSDLGNHVQAIAQDSTGFMWFGSQYGLHRWDGYQFKTYLNNGADPSSISSDYIEYIYVAKDGSLWLGTWGGGLNHFDPKTQRFTHYLHKPQDPRSLSNNYVSHILEDRDGYLWISTQYGLNRFDPKTGKCRRFLNDPNDPNSLSYDKCRIGYMDKEGTLWFGTGWPWEGGTGGGLNRYDPQTGGFIRYEHETGNPKSLINNKVTQIYEDSRGNFWVGTLGDGLHLMDRADGTFTRLRNKPGLDDNLSVPKVAAFDDWHTRFVVEDRHKKLWIGGWRGGLKFYDPVSGYIRHFTAESTKSCSTGGIPDNYIWTLFQSKDGTFWASTAGPGARVFKISEGKSIFQFVGGAIEDYTQAFCESASGILWVGTRTDGLHRIDPRTGDVRLYRNDPAHPQVFYQKEDFKAEQFTPDKPHLFDNIWKIVEDRDGSLWMSKWMQGAGLMHFNPATGSLRIYLHDPERPESLASNTVMDILIDQEGHIWASTGNGELSRYNPATDGFEHIRAAMKPLAPLADNLKDNFFSKMTLARDGTIWICGSGGGKANIPLTLNQFDPKTRSYRPHQLKLNTSESATTETVNGLEEDREGNIWINTDFSLRKVNPQSGIITAYSAQHLGTPVLRSLVIDNQGKLWLSGDGLIVFDPANGTSFNFNAAAGIKTMPFHWRAAYKSADGHLLFGGRSGFHVVRPDDLSSVHSALPPQVLITDFKLFDQSVSPGPGEPIQVNIWDAGEVRLAYDQDVFSFRFAALDFLAPEANRHRFKLEGYDQDWRQAGLEPMATYVKVPPGTYTFRVQAANRNGMWGKETTIRVVILPPWWATWWAYVLYAAMAAGVLTAFYRVQLKRRLDQAEALRLRELDAVKTRLYTNITHEFRTPLTVILGMVQQARENPARHTGNALDMIERNGRQLLGLVNQLLDLAKLESGNMPLHLQQSDLVSFLQYQVSSFQSFAEGRGVQLHFLSDVDRLLIDHDPERLQQVVGNLLSNALKFTPAGGHVYLDLSLKPADRRDTEQQVLIRVRDTGIGIPEEQLPHIFNRFYQADTRTAQPREGSGIGLAMTRELVKLMDGEISVRSRPGRGTEFAVLLPVRQQAELQTTSFDWEPADHGLLPAEAESQAAITPADSGRPLILLAEDNADVVTYLAGCLAGSYRLLVGKDGQEALDIATEHVPDLVITDVMMPRKDGFELCRTLRRDERTSHIPLIMLTAKADSDSLLEGLELGADAYLTKPFDKKELLVRIRKLLESRQRLRDHYLMSAGLRETPLMHAVEITPALNEADDRFVQKIRQVVETQLDNGDFDVEQLCRAMAMSHSQLHRKLSALTGLSATKFIRQVRLHKAKELLHNKTLSITAIAFDTGYNDPSYFGRVFRQEFGLTPQEWREREAVACG